MCLKYPLKVVSVNKDELVVDKGGEFITVICNKEVDKGDYVLIDQGVITEVYNKEMEDFFKEQGC